MSRPQRRPAWQWTTLLVSIALAGTLGATLYFTTSSLPYLASSPSTDPSFGALNACLHHEAPSRVGFAVARDARSAAVWSTNLVVRCSLDTDETKVKRWDVAGVTVAAFDGAGNLWVVSQASGLSSTLIRLTDQGQTDHGESGVKDLIGTSNGLVVLEESGRLVALSAEADGTGVAEVPTGRALRLSTSGDGQRVAVTGDGAIRIFEATKLTPVRMEAPCDVSAFWWLRDGHRALIDCRADEVSLIIDVETGAQETAPRAKRPTAFLAGPAGPYVEPCDLLPCTSAEPLGETR